MILTVYAIRDIHTGFLTPTIEQNDASAVRNFRHACLNKDSLFFTHASDYSLYRIGTYDTATGTLEAFPVPEIVCQASDFKEV